YMSPYQIDFNTTNGQVTRYNTGKPFADPASWELFETRTLHPDSRGFHGAINHGQYIYFVPYLRLGKEYSGRLARYNKSREFCDPDSWLSIDLTNFNSRACGFVSGTCEGKYIYLAPYFDGTDRYGQVARYNTEADIENPDSWEWFDSALVDSGSRGFFGAISDGRFIYFIPHCRGVGAYHGQMTRYDTMLEFNNPCAWSICDTARAHPDCRGLMGGVIHGGYLYMAPFETDAGEHSGLMVRLKLEAIEPWL
ncbi:MAG: hypothetical protein HQK67_13195, partial [Desulfamplus sp.]|nr:hypothetical protein [Desulfamplus sp.]